MYITNNPEVAQIAQRSGVDRIWVDMEWIGKEERQAGMNTVKSHHTIQDIVKLRPVVTDSTLMVRVNPMHEATKDYCGSKEEIDETVKAGAEVIMLPMFKTVREVDLFVNYVAGRAKVQLLVETKEANECIEKILEVPGIDEVHIGLNDLHLAYKKKFMFELLCDGTVDRLAGILRQKGVKYGFGGIARVGYGMLPAEYIIAEHYKLGSTAAILSRNFCDANVVKDPNTIADIFAEGVRHIREKEMEVAGFTARQYQANHEIVVEKVGQIVLNITKKQ
ncbi:MAG: Uncharacterized protein AUK63_52 [bacterium P3]|nr:MAG: Uncharacterized protein AUK63_52 [bacterium P3]